MKSRTTRNIESDGAGSRRRRAAGLLGACAALAGACAASGCNYAAAAALVIGGPPKQPAAFQDFPPEKKTVVVVDDRGNIAPRRSLRRVMGEEIEQELIGQGVLKAEFVIPSTGVMYVLSQEKRSDTMSVVDIGRALGAETVIYVALQQFTLSRDGGSAMQPGASAFVKVFDAANNTRLFPPEAGRGFPVSYIDPNPGIETPQSTGERARAEDALAVSFGRRVAQLFYDHERDSAYDKRARE